MTTILVVEDDPINWMVFQKVLKRRGGLDSIHSEDVEEVLNIVRSGEVSVVLMDVSLKNSHYQGESVDGIRITQLLKADPETAKLPVILVTANAMVGDRETFPQSQWCRWLYRQAHFGSRRLCPTNQTDYCRSRLRLKILAPPAADPRF